MSRNNIVINNSSSSNSNVTGIVGVHFSNASDLHPGNRDIRISTDNFSVPVSYVLDKIWAVKGTSPAVVAQHEILVFPTDQHGSIVFDPARVDELRPRSLRMDSLVRNYSQIEVTALLMTEAKQKARDAAAEEEELLRDLEQPAVIGGALFGAISTGAGLASKATAIAGGAASANYQQQAAAAHDHQQQHGNSAETELKRKATLSSLTLPLCKKRGADVANQDNQGKCLLCRSAPVRRAPADAAKLGRGCPCDAATQCRKKCCDQCYLYCFSTMLFGRQCPVCGRLPGAPAATTTAAAAEEPAAVVIRNNSNKQQQQQQQDEEETVVVKEPKAESFDASASGRSQPVQVKAPEQQQQQQRQQQQLQSSHPVVVVRGGGSAKKSAPENDDEEEDVVVNEPVKFRRVQ